MKFTPLVTFKSPETESMYVEGLSYTVRPGNKRLARLVERWLKEGKVAHGGYASIVTGKG